MGLSSIPGARHLPPDAGSWLQGVTRHALSETGPGQGTRDVAHHSRACITSQHLDARLICGLTVGRIRGLTDRALQRITRRVDLPRRFSAAWRQRSRPAFPSSSRLRLNTSSAFARALILFLIFFECTRFRENNCRGSLRQLFDPTRLYISRRADKRTEENAALHYNFCIPGIESAPAERRALRARSFLRHGRCAIKAAMAWCALPIGPP